MNVVRKIIAYRTTIAAIIIFSGCFGIYEGGEPIFEKRIEKYDSGKIKLECDGYLVKNYDETGRITEVYGNSKAWDNDLNFKELNYYEENQLIEKHSFFFEERTDFKIRDSSAFRNDKFLYDDSKVEIMLRFFPEYDSTGFTGKRILGFWENRKTNQSGTERDLKLKQHVLDSDNLSIQKVIEQIRK